MDKISVIVMSVLILEQIRTQPRKAIREMKTLQRINKHTVMAQLRKGKTWKGFLAGDNTNSFHIVNGWYLGYPVTVSSIDELNDAIGRYELYLEPELGKRAVLWHYA